MGWECGAVDKIIQHDVGHSLAVVASFYNQACNRHLETMSCHLPRPAKSPPSCTCQHSSSESEEVNEHPAMQWPHPKNRGRVVAMEVDCIAMR